MPYVFINDQGQEEAYGPYTKKSRFSDKELLALHAAMIKEWYPGMYERIKDDPETINAVGWGIDLDDRYEALLEQLPQSSFSKAGTHPMWVADGIKDNNTYNDDIVDVLVDVFDSAEDTLEMLTDVANDLGLDIDAALEERREMKQFILDEQEDLS